jgi:hypothetical protein
MNLILFNRIINCLINLTIGNQTFIISKAHKLYIVRVSVVLNAWLSIVQFLLTSSFCHLPFIIINNLWGYWTKSRTQCLSRIKKIDRHMIPIVMRVTIKNCFMRSCPIIIIILQYIILYTLLNCTNY